MKDDPLRIDWHCHSTWSDGRANLPALAAQARARRVTLGISDHGLSDNRRLCSQAQIDSYLSALSRYPLLRGLEISVGDLGQPGANLSQPKLPGMEPDQGCPVDLSRLDYLVASLHSVYIPEGRVHATRYHNYRAGLYPGYKRSLARYPRRAFFETWLAQLEATAQRWPVTILGHFCLLPELARADASYVLEQDPEPDAEATEFLDATAALCVRHRIAIEINSKSRVPHVFFLKRALELGATFSLGSDGHRLSAAGDTRYSQRMLERAGIPASRLLRLQDVRPDLVEREDEQAAG